MVGPRIHHELMLHALHLALLRLFLQNLLRLLCILLHTQIISANPIKPPSSQSANETQLTGLICPSFSAAATLYGNRIFSTSAGYCSKLGCAVKPHIVTFSPAFVRFISPSQHSSVTHLPPQQNPAVPIGRLGWVFVLSAERKAAILGRETLARQKKKNGIR